MFNFEPILKASSNGVLATQDGNKVKTRIFSCLFTDGKKAYFCTSDKKPVYAQIKANPQVSFCTWMEDYAPVLSVNGKVVFIEDTSLKKYVLDENPELKVQYNTADNPHFKLFYIDTEEAETFSMVEGLKTYKM